MSPQYQGNLFDSSGPAKFAASVSLISDAMKDVVSTFVDLDAKASTALQNIQSRMSNIQSGAPTGGQQWSNSGGPKPGNSGGVGVGTPTPIGGDYGFTGQRQQTSNPMGGNTSPTGSMGMRAVQSLPMAIGSAANNYAAATQGSMQQMTAYGSIASQSVGWSQSGQNRMSTVPSGALAQNQQDFAQSSYSAFMVGGVSAASTSTLGQSNYKANQQTNNALQTMMPGTSAVGAQNIQNQLYSSPEQQALLRLGLSPALVNGARTNPQSIFLPLLQRITTNHANSISPDAMNSIRQGMGGMIDEALGPDVGNAFWTWAIQYVGYTSKHNGQPPPNLFSAAGQKAVGANENPITAKLRADSAKATAQSKLNPAQAKVSQTKSGIMGKLYGAASGLLGGAGANIVGYGGAAAGILGGPLSMLGGLFGGGGGGLAGGAAGAAGAGAGGTGAGAAGLMGGGEAAGGLGGLLGGAGALLGTGALVAGGVGVGISGLLGKGGGAVAKAIGGFGLLGGAAKGLQGLFGHHTKHPAPTAATTMAMDTTDGLSKVNSSSVQDIFKLSSANVGGQGGTGALATILGAIGLNALIKGGQAGALDNVNQILAGGLQNLSQSISGSIAGGVQSVGGQTIAGATLTSMKSTSPGALVSNIFGGGSSGSGGTGTSGKTSVSSSPTASVGGPVGNISDVNGFATAFLSALGAPATAANVSSVVAWANREGGNWHNNAKYNPLNTTQTMPGSSSINSVGVQSYTSWSQGIQAVVQTINNGRYSDILQGLAGGGGLSSGHYPGLSTWSGGGYDHLARGSYNIGADHLAVVHAGERIIPAAENYSVSGRYSRGSGGPGGSSGIYLHFGPNSIVFNGVPMNPAGGVDVTKMGNDFVQSVATNSALLANLRSN